MRKSFLLFSEAFLWMYEIIASYCINTESFPPLHILIQPIPLQNLVISLNQKYKKKRKRAFNNLTSSFPSHLVSTWILTTQSDSSTGCYIRGVEAKGIEEVEQAQETAKRKTSLKLPWISDTYLFVLLYGSESLWNRKIMKWPTFLLLSIRRK